MIIDAATAGVPVRSLYLEVFQPVLREVGRRWQENDLNVAEEHTITAVVQLAMAHLYPHVFGAPRTGRGCVVCAASGDLHEIGARMVADFLEMAGWDTTYLGGNTPTPDLLRVIERRGVPLLCVSVSLATHLRTAAELIGALRREPLGAQVRVLAGGRPFVLCPRLWRTIGADGSGEDAAAAVVAAEALVPPRSVAPS
jgi:methanogenic corrinoid protein MtbC1